ncbi:MAG: Rpn family recombination-promoting nuclease/putative transposase [Oscillospiraceae bacterium]|nr:Rpn family recombination-promoting nuclease/putative transposase [Oscillospiraceae bacterium]
MTDRKTIVDVRAKLKDKRQIAIEMQIQNYRDMGKRSLFEWAKMYGSQLNKNDKYKDLAKCICINITAFDYTEKKSGYSRSVIKDADTNEIYKGMDDLEIYFIELPKRDRVKDDRLRKWMTLFSSKSWGEMELNAKGDEIMTQVYEQAREIAMNESKRIAIHRREKFLIDQNSLKEDGRDEGYLMAQKEFEDERKDYEDRIKALEKELKKYKK